MGLVYFCDAFYTHLLAGVIYKQLIIKKPVTSSVGHKAFSTIYSSKVIFSVTFLLLSY